jgi:L-threonylcarbamoyladenylate synthase
MKVLPESTQAWRLAREAIVRGDLIVVPTDTVYGLACDAHNAEAIEKLFAAKGREHTKAIPLLLSGLKCAGLVTSALPDAAVRLGQALWPGALTLVMPRGPGLPANLGGGDTIAVRVPDHSALRSFLETCGGLLAATSANISGLPDALTAEQAAAYLGASVAVVIDGGPAPGGVPSTVVDCTSSSLAVLREGAISRHRILSILGEPV